MQLLQFRPNISTSVFSSGEDLDYSQGTVFGGINSGLNVDLNLIMSNVWQHPMQQEKGEHVTGEDILKSLVPSFDHGFIDPGSIHLIQPEDSINGHVGVDILCFIRDHWDNFPKHFCRWVTVRRLYAIADTFWGDDGHLYFPMLTAMSGRPNICGHSVYLDFGNKDVFLRD